MKIWNKIKSWIVKPYMKPLVLKDEIKVADLQYKTKKQHTKYVRQHTKGNIHNVNRHKTNYNIQNTKDKRQNTT